MAKQENLHADKKEVIHEANLLRNSLQEVKLLDVWRCGCCGKDAGQDIGHSNCSGCQQAWGYAMMRNKAIKGYTDEEGEEELAATTKYLRHLDMRKLLLEKQLRAVQKEIETQVKHINGRKAQLDKMKAIKIQQINHEFIIRMD
eukprot:279121_1